VKDSAEGRAPRARRIARAIGLAALFAALFLFRLSSASITNDDYLHLSTAQQLLLGGVPVRDFLDPGELFFYSTSAAAQLLLGRTVLSEVLLDAFFLSLGQVLVFVLASRAARSAVVGLLASAFPVVIVARLYSYPKTFLYAVALALIWRYIGSRRRRDLLVLSAWTGVAFLFRHDHGGYIGATAAAMLLIVHGRDRPALLRAMVSFAVPIAVILVPFLVFLQVNGGIAFYVRSMLDTARGEYARTVGQVPPFHLTWVGPMPWFAAPTPGEADPNVTAWHYYVTVAMAPLTMLVLAADWLRRRAGTRVRWHGMDHEAAKMTCAAVLGVLMHTYLLRARSDSAIADVSALTAVLGAWLMARGLSAGWHGGRMLLGVEPRRSVLGAAAGLALAAVTVGVYAVTMQLLASTPGGELTRRFVRALDAGYDPLGENVERLARMKAPYEDAGAGAQYLSTCTAETDRVLISSGYRPELYYAAGRGFAAGRLYYLNSLAPDPEFKAFSLARLQAERVPIALLDPSDREFEEKFDGLYRYLRQHYRRAGQVEFWNVRFDVLVDSRLAPAGTWGGELPCFAH
jgi:hypothetical protein